MTDGDVAISMFERIGGSATINRLVDRFYERMDTLPEAKIIRAMHADDLGLIRDVLKRYLIEWTGGPKLYSVEKGHPRRASATSALPSAMPSATRGCSASAARSRRPLWTPRRGRTSTARCPASPTGCATGSQATTVATAPPPRPHATMAGSDRSIPAPARGRHGRPC